MATLGEKLREAREARGYTLREVADNTRISVRHLEAIEADDYRPLPGGVFNKGFIKAFARYVGVDEAEALSDYTKQINQQGLAPEPDDDAPISRKHEVFVGDEPRRPFLTVVLAFIMLGLLSWGVIAALQWYQNRESQPIAAATPTPTPAANSNSATATPTPTPAVSAADGLNVQLKSSTQKVSLEVTADGKKQSLELNPGEARDFSAQQALKFRYAKVLAGDLQMTINGRPAKVQLQPANPRMNGIDMEITRENFQQFLQ